VAVVAVGAAIGCGDDSQSPNPQGSGSITLSLSSADAMTAAGDTRTLSAIVKSASGDVLHSPAVTFESSAPSVATVVGSGTSATITAVADGEAVVRATSGAVHDSVRVTVHRVLAAISLSAPSPTLLLGSSVQLTVLGLDARQHEIQGLTGFMFTSNNTGAVVSPSGLVTSIFRFLPVSRATITASLTRDGATVSGSTQIEITQPLSFDFGALLLSYGEHPGRMTTYGAGVTYFALGAARLDYRVAWSMLTGPATSVHIHGPAGEGEDGDVLVSFNPAVQSTSYGTVTGSITAQDIVPRNGQPPISLDSLIKLVAHKDVYVDVHTVEYPEGEIRGQTQLVIPNPASARVPSEARNSRVVRRSS
jgi:hypothetical protein